MTDDWNRVDDYLGGLLAPHDAALSGALAAQDAAGLPPIAVSQPQGKFLYLLARMIRTRRILEIGTLGGYSALWMARALPPDGRLLSCEIDPAHAAVARSSLAAAGLGDRVEVRVGPALDTLDQLLAGGAEAFDLVFCDADKINNAAYVRAALALTRPGSVIVVDNVVRGGKVLDDSGADEAVTGTREVLRLIAEEPRLDGTALQTVGTKDWDGFAIALVTG